MEEAKAETNAYVNEKLSALEMIWQRLGIPENQVITRRRDFVLHVVHLVETMESEELNAEKKVMDNIARSERKVVEIKEKLEPLSAEEESCLKESTAMEHETPLVKEKRLIEEKSELEGIKKKRDDTMAELIAHCQTLANEVSEKPHSLTLIKFSSTRIPAISEIEEISSRCKELKEIKRIRQEEFRQIRPRIAKWMKELGESPDETFEMDILMEPDENFRPTDENMTKLKELEQEIKQKYEKRMQEIGGVKKEIVGIWHLMEIEEDARQSFWNKVHGITEKDLSEYKTELGRLKGIRKSSLDNLTEKAIKELKKIRQDARILPPAEEDLEKPASEEFLSSLIREKERAETVFEERRSILAKVSDWTDKVNMLEDLMIKSKDPSRLKNRGGNLLEEERKRRSLEKTLPKITTTLLKNVKVWEGKHGQFLVDGMTVEEYRITLVQKKENERQKEQNDKKRKRQMETEAEMRYGSTNPNKAKKSKECSVKLKIHKPDGENLASMSFGEARLTPWGSMKYSPNKPPPGRPKSKLTAVGKSIKQFTSKLVQPEKKSSKTTDNLGVPSTSRTFAERKMRRRSKSLSCIRQDVLQRSALKAFKPGLRLPLPSATDASKLFTPKSTTRREGVVTGADSLHGTITDTEHSTTNFLSETIETRPRYLDSSVSARIDSVSQREFVGELLGDRPKNARSSIIPTRARR